MQTFEQKIKVTLHFRKMEQPIGDVDARHAHTTVHRRKKMFGLRGQHFLNS